ncbi:MAG: hypothetical protein AAB515_01010 [Patescibacteria group bacterium]
MSNVLEQNAIQKLAERLRDQTGQPVLILVECQVPSETEEFFSPRVPLDRKSDSLDNVRGKAFGVLNGETLTVDNENHPGLLGIPVSCCSTKMNLRDDITVQHGHFWLSGIGKDLMVNSNTYATVLIGAQEIGEWLHENRHHPFSRTSKELLEICALARRLQVSLQQWGPIYSVVEKTVKRLRADAEESKRTLHESAMKMLGETKKVNFSAIDSYSEISKDVLQLTGEALPKLELQLTLTT